MPTTQNFEVAMKAFIEKDGKLLILRERIGGLWELPGGRIEIGEVGMKLEDILRREIDEELGSACQVTIGKPFYSWIRPWPLPRKEYVFLTGFRCKHEGGDITLSEEHDEWRLVTRDDVDTVEWAPGYREAFEAYWLN